MNAQRLLGLLSVFAPISLLAVGGANAVLPEMQRQVVDLHGWLDGPDFAALVALSQAAPGPNVMVVGLIGWRVAGAPGAVAATVAMCGPPAVLSVAAGRALGRFRHSLAGRAFTEGMAPLTVGLVLASAWALMRANGLRPLPVILSVAVAGLDLAFPRRGLWLLGAAAAIAALAAR
jgi:chromate transporter